jgi:hypothetical protein
MLRVAWLVIMADGKIADDEALLIRHVVRLITGRRPAPQRSPRRGASCPRSSS